MQLTLKKTSFGFVPDDDETAKACAKVPIDSVVTREWRKPRNPKHHRMRFAWVPEIFAAIEHLQLFGNSELLRQFLTLQTEFVNTIINPRTGEVSRTPRSWAYASMDEDEFSRLVVQVHVQKVRFSHCGQVGLAELRRDKMTGKYFEHISEPSRDDRVF